MKAKDVLKLLRITRNTLYNYVKRKIIKVHKLPNGYFNYDDISVYNFINFYPRINIIYARVSTPKQKSDLNRQIINLSDYCLHKNIIIDAVYSDISSGISLDRHDFSILLQLIFEHKIDTIYISNKDRLTRLSYITLHSIFEHFGTKIVVVNSHPNDYYGELFEEIISMMHYFSTKEYSNRRKYKSI